MDLRPDAKRAFTIQSDAPACEIDGVEITRSSTNFGPYQYPEKVIPLFITSARMAAAARVRGRARRDRPLVPRADLVATAQVGGVPRVLRAAVRGALRTDSERVTAPLRIEAPG